MKIINPQIVFLVMGIILFASCFADQGDATHLTIPDVSFMAFGNRYILPLLFGGGATLTCLVLYYIVNKYLGGSWIMDEIIDATIDLKDHLHQIREEKEQKRRTKK